MKTSITKKLITSACTILALSLVGTSAQAYYGYGYGNGCGCVKRVHYVKRHYTCYQPVVRYYRPVVRYVRVCNPCYTYSSCSPCGNGGLFGGGGFLGIF